MWLGKHACYGPLWQISVVSIHWSLEYSNKLHLYSDMNIEVILHAWSATCDPMLELILNAFISRWQPTWWAFLAENNPLRWNKWWHIMFFFSKRNTTSSAILIYNPPTEHALIILFLVLLYSFCWLLHVSPLQAVKWNLSNLIYKRNTLNGFHHPNLDHRLRSRERTGVLIWHDQFSEVILLAAIRSYRCPFSDSLSVGLCRSLCRGKTLYFLHTWYFWGCTWSASLHQLIEEENGFEFRTYRPFNPKQVRSPRSIFHDHTILRNNLAIIRYFCIVNRFEIEI